MLRDFFSNVVDDTFELLIDKIEIVSKIKTCKMFVDLFKFFIISWLECCCNNI